ncbi:calcium-binding protein, partial [Neisseria meningitidis]|nr:calcium-binding protein [Neisseria meningitidis]MBG8764336.1 calcium-binding protein [Neisseria meningitidis]MBJ1800599.1 calcium-binding protein [Neisseria meningitidis]MBJ7753945.1 calcium-binding protein [Neisseria meningitidis]MBJ7878686.1 calcium-binding protein [Neisseria meningitidis]
MADYYAITVKFAEQGTPLKQGGVSKTGHVWVELYSARDKKIYSFGWSTGDSKTEGGFDNLVKDDRSNYINHPDTPISSITVPITKEQFDRAIAFPARAASGQVDGFTNIFGQTSYGILKNSCVDYGGKSIADIGLADKDFDGHPLKAPYYQYSDFLEQMEKHGESWILTERDGRRQFKWLGKPDPTRGWFDNGHECLKPWGNIFDSYRRGKYHVYDPLALDLDGDGIETVATKGFAGALFDHRNQGIRTATGWVSADDGLLVRDLNGNGIIDNGAELFGDNTKLADGSFAKHGYAALAELDSNGDNIINAADAAFQSLRVWQDLNQDGISQANELRTLEELGIQSLDLAYKDVNKNLGNGNTLAQQGSYTKTDGTTAKMGDLLLAADNLHSRFKDKVELTAEQAKAANLAGIGRLRDLREAAALSGDLANMLKAYSAAETKEAQLALLDNLIHKWAETDSNWGKKSPMRLSTDWTQTANEGIALTPSQVAQLKKNALVSLSDKAKAAIDAARDRIAVLDAYTGQDSSTLYYMSEEDALNIVKVTNDTYDHLAKNIYQNLLFQTRLQPYLNQISFKMENDTFTLDFSGLVQAFNHVKETNPQKAFVDLAEMLAYGELRSWYEGRRLMADYVEEAKKAGKFEDYQKVLGQETVALLAKTSGTQADDILQNVGFGHNKNVSLYGNDGNDTLIGGAGNDYLEGGSGSDTYVFGKGFGQDTV